MKVNNDLQKIHNQGKQKSTAATKSNKTQEQDFANIMNSTSAQSTSSAQSSEEVGSQDLSVGLASVGSINTISAILAEKLTAGKTNTTALEFEEEITTISSMLDGLDAYAEKITYSDSDKVAWKELEFISGQISQLKQQENLPEELKSIIEEIEALASAEQVKMNRGDYNEDI